MKTRSLLLAAILGFATSFAVAQTTQMSNDLAKRVSDAAAQGNGDLISQLATQNPASAALIAQEAIKAAKNIEKSNPAGAASLAAAAVTIVSTPAVINAAPRIAGQVAIDAVTIANNPAVMSANAGAVSTIVNTSNTIASNTAVVAVLPNIATQITTGSKTIVVNAAQNNIILAIEPTLNKSLSGPR